MSYKVPRVASEVTIQVTPLNPKERHHLQLPAEKTRSSERIDLVRQVEKGKKPRVRTPYACLPSLAGKWYLEQKLVECTVTDNAWIHIFTFFPNYWCLIWSSKKDPSTPDIEWVNEYESPDARLCIKTGAKNMQ